MLRKGLLATIVVASLVSAGTATAARPLVTAVHEPQIWSLTRSNADTAFARIAGAGSTVVRIWLDWRRIAPNPRALDFQPANPADPRYDWTGIDRQVRYAAAHGLRVLLVVREAPNWAQGAGQGRPGAVNPNVAEFALFSLAAATRYSGTFDPDALGAAEVLPRVSLWEIWNEPNLPYFLVPQRDAAGNSVAPAIYRALVNAAATSIHGVNPGNVVVAGSLAPFGPPDGHMALDFMRKLLCMSGGSAPKPVCGERIQLDAWSHHPYTMGGPTHHAYWPDDVSIGDLPEMRRLLRAAVRAGHVVSTRPIGFWVTEFSWETKPTDSRGVPTRLHARWTSEALYRMWRAGVTFVTWWLLRDRPFPKDYTQSGLYYCGSASLADEGTCETAQLTGDAGKRSIRAFRFPFVALPRTGRVFTWGRTPAGRPGAVIIERRGSGWKRVGIVRANRYGIFQKTWRIRATRGLWRARLANGRDRSVPFALKRPRDLALVHPFGCGGGLAC